MTVWQGELKPGGRSVVRGRGTTHGFGNRIRKSRFNSQPAHQWTLYNGAEQGELLKYSFSGEKCLTSNVFCKGGSSVDLMCSPCPALGPDLWPHLYSERVLSLPEPGFAYSTACHQLR